MYPVLGYLGIVLLLTLLAGWIKERGNIVYEKIYTNTEIAVNEVYHKKETEKRMHEK